MKRSLFMPAVLAAAFSLPTQADILISEVLYDPPNSLDASLEWVELFNTGCDAIDLSTYTLQDNQGSLNLSGFIQPNSYLIFANKADAFITKYNFAPNLTGMTHALGNSGDRLILKNNGIDVDTVAWENNLTGWAIAAVDITIYRINNTKPATNDHWAVSTADSPGTGPLIQDCVGEGTSSSSPINSSSSAEAISSSSSSIATSTASSVASSNASSNAMSSSEESSSSVSYSYDVYYAPTMGREGFELRTALHSIIKTGHIRLTYSQVWGALQYTDEDPDNTANVLLLYSGRSADKNDRDGQAGFDNDSWNREHVWAKSYGFPDEDQYAYTDIHHLRPEDKTVNSSRSNKAFDNGGLAEGEAPDTFTDNDSWEPRDSVKGDVARMLFYMDVRYEGTDGNTPDLVLVDNTVMATGDANIGKLCTLIEWNQQDPVNNLEMRRNNRIQERQGNRNPFIDNPDWALSLWGTFCGVTSSSSSGASSSVFSSNVSSISSSIAEAASSSSITPSSSSSSLPISSSSSTSSAASSNSSSGGGSLDWLGLLLLLGLVRLRR